MRPLAFALACVAVVIATSSSIPASSIATTVGATSFSRHANGGRNLRDQALQTAALRARRSVYRVMGYRAGAAATHWGTAIILCGNPDVAVTARHVVALNHADSIVLEGIAGVMRVTGVLYDDVAGDVTILELSAPAASCLRVSDSLPLPGMRVAGIGVPDGVAPRIAIGVYEGVTGRADTTWLQHRASLPHGASGGAILNNAGEVLGVIHGFARRDSTIGFATPIRTVLNAWRSGPTRVRGVSALFGERRRVPMRPPIVITAEAPRRGAPRRSAPR